jgi:hypothetical protein
MTHTRFGSRGPLQLYESTTLFIVDLIFSDGDRVRSIFRSILNMFGFCWIHHRTALTVFRRGKFLYVLEAPDGHRWQHYWAFLNDERAGPVISLTPTLVTAHYDNIPTSLGPGRPISIGMRLMISYLFEPQSFPDASAEFVEGQIQGGPPARDETLRKFCRPELERLMGELNPIEVRLRQRDPHIREMLQARLRERVRPVAFRIIMADIEEVILPPKLETELTANLELLRQSVHDYTPTDLARIATAKMSEGWGKGNPPITTANVDPIVRRSMSDERSTIIDMPPDGHGGLHPPDSTPQGPTAPDSTGDAPGATEPPTKEPPPRPKRKY